MNGTDLRAAVASALADRDTGRAAALLRELWRTSPTLSTAGFVAERAASFRGAIPLTPFRLAVLRSFTVEPAVPLLRASAFCAGIDLEIHLGDFNAYAQEILDPSSSLYAFKPDAVILAVQTEDIGPDIAASPREA